MSCSLEVAACVGSVPVCGPSLNGEPDGFGEGLERPGVFPCTVDGPGERHVVVVWVKYPCQRGDGGEIGFEMCDDGGVEERLGA